MLHQLVLKNSTVPLQLSLTCIVGSEFGGEDEMEKSSDNKPFKFTV